MNRGGTLKAVQRQPTDKPPDSVMAQGAQPRTARWPLILLAAVACVVAFVAIGTNSHSGRPDPDIANDGVAAHIRSLQAAHLLDMTSDDPNTVKLWFNGRLNYAPDVPHLRGFDLAGGRLDYFDQRGLAAIVYRYRQHVVNLFTWPATQPDAGAGATALQGFHVVHWVRAGMEWWAVSDLPENELKQMATAATETAPGVRD